MKEKLNNMVGKVCQNCVFGCFKTTCSRTDWCNESYPDTHYGMDEKCPMEQFEASKPTVKQTMFGPRCDITVRETWAICENCSFSEVKDNTISIDAAFEAHCMDCPNRSIRESLEENYTESRMS